MPINADLEGNISIEGLLFIPNPRIKPAIMMLLTQYKQFTHFVFIWQDCAIGLSINTNLATHGIENSDNIECRFGFWHSSTAADNIQCTSSQKREKIGTMTKLVWTTITLSHSGFHKVQLRPQRFNRPKSLKHHLIASNWLPYSSGSSGSATSD